MLSDFFVELDLLSHSRRNLYDSPKGVLGFPYFCAKWPLRYKINMPRGLFSHCSGLHRRLHQRYQIFFL